MKELNSSELLDLIAMTAIRINECEKAIDTLITNEAISIVTKRMLELTNIKTKLEIKLKNK